jgi:signal transduction histidine kinase
LTQAVRNLLDNAARHATSVITITLEESEAGASLSVADDGPGIPQDAQQRVFERFSRLDDARDRDAGGTGLGLAITSAIIIDHGGTISVENTPGARFTVSLPT